MKFSGKRARMIVLLSLVAVTVVFAAYFIGKRLSIAARRDRDTSYAIDVIRSREYFDSVWTTWWNPVDDTGEVQVMVVLSEESTMAPVVSFRWDKDARSYELLDVKEMPAK